MKISDAARMLRPQTPPAEYQGAVLGEAISGLLKSCKWYTAIILGPVGTGKTYSMWAVQRRNVSGKETSGRHTVHIISECLDIDRMRYDQSLLDAWCQFPGLLVIDDIGYRRPTTWTIQAVYAISTTRRAEKRKTIWTTNLTDDEIRDYYGQAIASRIMGGLVIRTRGDDRRPRYHTT